MTDKREVEKPMKTERKGPIERELRLWGHSLFGHFVPWTEIQQILLDLARMRGLTLCNGRYRYQEALIDWVLKQSALTGNKEDILCREMVQVCVICRHKFTKQYFIEGKNRSRGERFPLEQLATYFERIYVEQRAKRWGISIPPELDIGLNMPLNIRELASWIVQM